MNLGIINEKEIVNEIHGKRIRELSPFWKETIKKMFNEEDESCCVIARRVLVYYHCKTDIEIQVRNITKNVSVKSGRFPSIHQESIKNFIEFLESIGISKRTINIIKFYHYGDGTLDGTGTRKMGENTLKDKYEYLFKEASKELSQPEIIKKIVYRGLIKGRRESLQEIDYLYYGDASGGIMCSKDEILSYAPRNKKDRYRAIHFGPVVMFNKQRINSSTNYYSNEYIQLRWPTLWIDMKNISEERTI